MKTTVNLETVLRRQNKKIATPQELLAIQQYDRISGETVVNVLTKAGLKGAVEPGKTATEKLAGFEADIKTFPVEKVFHITQIKALCEKYQLKFLPTELYRGFVPADLGSILVEQEIKHGFTLKPETTFIMAPASTFELKVDPKDPLIFHKINGEYYFLMHKWGNDLSVFRTFLKYVNALTVGTFLGLLFGIVAYFNVEHSKSGDDILGGLFMFFIWAVAGVMVHSPFEYDKPFK